MATHKTSLPRKDRRAHRLLYEGVLKSLALSGELTEEVLRNPKRIDELVLNALDTLHLGTDHREVLLEQARKYWAAKQYEIAYIFYATFFEHCINLVIVTRVAQRLSAKSSVEVVKTLSIAAKFGWLLELTGLPVFNSKHRATIANVADQRNAFIHFKFPTQPISSPDNAQDAKDLEIRLRSIKAAIRYMKAYTTRVVDNGMSNKIKKAVKQVQAAA